MKFYKRLPALNRFRAKPGGRKAFVAEMSKRARGLSITIDQGFFGAQNPLNDRDAVDFVHQRYGVAFDYIDRHPPVSILEIGAGYGLASWLLSDAVDRVVALDINPTRARIGRYLFPEVEFVCEDYRTYLRRDDVAKFELILASWVPIGDLDDFRDKYDRFIRIGYWPKSWRDVLSWDHKPAGLQLSFNTAVIGRGLSGIDPRYPMHYLGAEYLGCLRRSLRKHRLPIW